MDREKEFDNILDECLERVFRGEAVESCLADYPAYAEELEPLLRTALASKEAVDIRPRPDFRERARYQFQAAIREAEEKKTRGFFFGWQPRWVVAVVSVLVILLAGSGTVAAAANSLPGDALYPVKLATESVRLALTPSAMGKAELYIELADERVDEIIRLADRGDAEQVELTSRRLGTQLLAMVSLDVTGGEGDYAHKGVLEMSAVETTQASAGGMPEETVTQTTTATTTVTSAVTPPSTTTTVPSPATDEADGYTFRAPGLDEDALPGWKGEGAEPGSPAALQGLIAQHAVENQAELQAVLETAPESVRAALEDAIRIAGQGYQQAIDSLNLP